ncbi:hypothetical protein ON010_g9254 [Phytophthora cinnamomi]|nr:hypothetical protein ON010_g9254 [Phytophthora cinnamomi]
MDHDQVGAVSGSSDACVEEASTTDYVYARQLVQAYFVMLTAGCKRDGCTNANCRSNPRTPALTAAEAVIKSIYLATQAPVPLCVDVDQGHEELLSTAETPLPTSPAKAQQQDLASSGDQPQAVEENQSEDVNDEDQQSKQELYPETPEMEGLKSQQPEKATADEDQHSNEELHPETSEAEVSKFQHPESISTDSTASAEIPLRKSTPRRRLSVAVKLDNGLNKGRESPAKRPTIITRVVVQPKHKSVIDPAASLANDVTVTTVVEAPESKVEIVPEQQQELPSNKLASTAQDARQRRLSRPKEKLFDAIKRSFSRTKKAPLGSA